MESLLRQCDKDCMKMAMLKHEETFREQVSELHRLYEVQKLLMRQLKKSSEYKRQSNSAKNRSDIERCTAKKKNDSQGHSGPCRRSLNLELPADEYIEDTERNARPENEQESDIELTLSIGSSRRKKDVALLTSDSGSFSSSTGSSGENNKFHNWGLFQMLTMNTGHPGSSTFDVKEPSKQDRLDQPAWQYKCLSLNMT